MPKKQEKGKGDTGTTIIESSLYENYDPDPLLFINETQIGSDGMKIDRMYFDKFEDTVKEDDFAKEQYEEGNYQVVQRYIEEEIMNKPSEYYTWDKIRRAINIDRRVTVKEILDKVFGRLPAFKTRGELVAEEFEGYMLTRDVSSDKYDDIRRFFETYITDKEVRRIIEDKKYQYLGTEVSSYTIQDLKKLGINNMSEVVNYVNDNVNVTKFMM